MVLDLDNNLHPHPFVTSLRHPNLSELTKQCKLGSLKIKPHPFTDSDNSDNAMLLLAVREETKQQAPEQNDEETPSSR